MAVVKNRGILKYLLLMVVSLLLVLDFSIGVSASSGYDRQGADTCITIGERLYVKTSYGKSSENVVKTSYGKSRKKTYQTYTKTNPQTGEVYSGRTSGYGTPAENIQKRDANHHMNGKGFGTAVLDKSSSNYNAIRGREQMLITKHGGAKKTGETSGNAINGIGKNNKKKSIYINSAIEEFGGVE